jgi:chromosome segregation ATPase
MVFKGLSTWVSLLQDMLSSLQNQLESGSSVDMGTATAGSSVKASPLQESTDLQQPSGSFAPKFEEDAGLHSALHTALNELGCSISEVSSHADMAAEEVELLVDALASKLQAAQVAADTAATMGLDASMPPVEAVDPKRQGPQAAVADTEPSGIQQLNREQQLLQSADAILAEAEQILTSVKVESPQAQATAPGVPAGLMPVNAEPSAKNVRVIETLLSITAAADHTYQLVTSSNLASLHLNGAADSPSSRREAPSGSVPADSRADSQQQQRRHGKSLWPLQQIFGTVPAIAGMEPFLNGLVEKVSVAEGKTAAAGPPGKSNGSNADLGMENAPLISWFERWSCTPGWGEKAAWLRDWARAQQAGQESSSPSSSSGRHLRDELVAASGLLVGLSPHWWGESSAPEAQEEYGADGGGMDGGGPGGGKGPHNGGIGSGGDSSGGDSSARSGDNNHSGGSKAGRNGGKGGGGGPPPKGRPGPWDGFEKFPPSGGFDPVLVVPLAFAAVAASLQALTSGQYGSPAIGQQPSASLAKVNANVHGDAAVQEAQLTVGNHQAMERKHHPGGGRAAAARATAEVCTLSNGMASMAFQAMQMLSCIEQVLPAAQLSIPDVSVEVPLLGWAPTQRARCRRRSKAPSFSNVQRQDGLLDAVLDGKLLSLSWGELEGLPTAARREILALRAELRDGWRQQQAAVKEMQQLKDLLKSAEQHVTTSYAQQAKQNALSAAASIADTSSSSSQTGDSGRGGVEASEDKVKCGYLFQISQLARESSAARWDAAVQVASLQANYEAALAAASSQISELENRLGRSLSYQSKQRSMAEQLQCKLDEALKLLNGLQEEHATVVKEASVLAQEVLVVKRTHAQDQQQLTEAFIRQVSDLQQNLDISNDQVEMLASEMQAAAAQHAASVAELKQQLNKAQQTVEASQQQLLRIQQQQTQQLGSTATADGYPQQPIGELNKEHATAVRCKEAEKASLQQQLEHVSEELAGLHSVQGPLIAGLEAELAQQRSSAALEAHSYKVQLETARNQAATQLQEQEAQQSFAVLQTSAWAADMSKLQAQLDEASKQLRSAQESAAAEVSGMRRRLMLSESRVESLTADLAAAASDQQLEKIQQQHAAAIAEAAHLKGELEHVKVASAEVVQQLEMKVQELQTEVGVAQQQIDHLQKAAAAFQKEKGALKHQLASEAASVAPLQGQMDSLTSELAQLGAALSNSEGQLEELTCRQAVQMKAALMSKSAVESQLQQLSAELVQMQQELAQQQQQASSDLEEAKQGFNRYTSQLEAELAASRGAAEYNIAQLRSLLANAQQERDELRDALSLLEPLGMDNIVQHSSVQNGRTKAHREVAAMIASRKGLEQAVACLQDQVKAAERKHEVEKTGLQAKLDAASSELEDLQLLGAITAKSQADDLQAKLESAAAARAEGEQQVLQLQGRLAAAETAAGEETGLLKQQLTVVQQQLSELIELHAADKVRIEGQLSVAAASAVSLQGQLLAAVAAAAEQEEKMQAVQQEVLRLQDKSEDSKREAAMVESCLQAELAAANDFIADLQEQLADVREGSERQQQELGAQLAAAQMAFAAFDLPLARADVSGAEVAVTVQGHLAATQTEVARLEQELSAATAESASQISKLQLNLAQAISNADLLEKRLGEENRLRHAEQLQAEQQQQSMQVEVQAVHEQLYLSQNEAVAARRDASAAATVMEGLTMQLAAAQQEAAEKALEIAKLAAQVAQTTAAAEKVEANWAKSCSQHIAEVSALEFALEEAEEQRQACEARVVAAAASAAAAAAILEKEQERQAATQSAVQAELEQMLFKMTADRAKLKNALGAAEAAQAKAVAEAVMAQASTQQLQEQLSAAHESAATEALAAAASREAALQELEAGHVFITEQLLREHEKALLSAVGRSTTSIEQLKEQHAAELLEVVSQHAADIAAIEKQAAESTAAAAALVTEVEEKLALAHAEAAVQADALQYQQGHISELQEQLTKNLTDIEQQSHLLQAQQQEALQKEVAFLAEVEAARTEAVVLAGEKLRLEGEVSILTLKLQAQEQGFVEHERMLRQQLAESHLGLASNVQQMEMASAQLQKAQGRQAELEAERKQLLERVQAASASAAVLKIEQEQQYQALLEKLEGANTPADSSTSSERLRVHDGVLGAQDLPLPPCHESVAGTSRAVRQEQRVKKEALHDSVDSIAARGSKEKERSSGSLGLLGPASSHEEAQTAGEPAMQLEPLPLETQMAALIESSTQRQANLDVFLHQLTGTRAEASYWKSEADKTREQLEGAISARFQLQSQLVYRSKQLDQALADAAAMDQRAVKLQSRTEGMVEDLKEQLATVSQFSELREQQFQSMLAAAHTKLELAVSAAAAAAEQGAPLQEKAQEVASQLLHQLKTTLANARRYQEQLTEVGQQHNDVLGQNSNLTKQLQQREEQHLQLSDSLASMHTLKEEDHQQLQELEARLQQACEAEMGLQKQLEEACAEKQHLESRWQSIAEQKQVAEQQLATAAAAQKQLQDHLDKYLEEICVLKQQAQQKAAEEDAARGTASLQLEAANKQLSAAQSRASELEAQLQQAQEESSSVQVQLSASLLNLEQLQQKLAAEQGAHSQVLQELQRVENVTTALEQQLAVASADQSASTAKLQELYREQEATAELLAAALLNREKALEQLQDAFKEQTALVMAVTKAEDTLRVLETAALQATSKDELARLTGLQDELETIKVDFGVARKEWSEVVASKQEQEAKHEAQILDLKEQLRNKDAEIQALREQFLFAESSLQMQQCTHKQQTSALSAAIEAAQQAADQQVIARVNIVTAQHEIVCMDLMSGKAKADEELQRARSQLAAMVGEMKHSCVVQEARQHGFEKQMQSLTSAMETFEEATGNQVNALLAIMEEQHVSFSQQIAQLQTLKDTAESSQVHISSLIKDKLALERALAEKDIHENALQERLGAAAAHIRQCQQELEDVQASKSLLEKCIQQLVQEVKQLADVEEQALQQLSAQNSKVVELEVQLLAAEHTFQQLQSSKESAQADMAAQLQQLDAVLQATKQELEGVSASKGDSEEQLLELQFKASAALSCRDVLEQQAEQLKAELLEVQEEMAALKSSSTHLQEQLCTANLELQQQRDQSQILCEQLTAAHEQVHTATASSSALQQELEDLLDSKAATDNHLKEAELTNKYLQEKVLALEVERLELLQQLQDLQQQAQSAQEHVSSMQRERLAVQEENENLQKQIQEQQVLLTQQLQASQSDLEALNAAAHQQQQAASVERMDVLQQVDVAAVQQALLSQQLQEQQQTAAELQKQLGSAEQSAADTVSLIRDLQEQLQEANNLCQAEHQQAEELKAKKVALLKELAEARDKEQRLREELLDSEARLEDARKQMDVLQNEKELSKVEVAAEQVRCLQICSSYCNCCSLGTRMNAG